MVPKFRGWHKELEQMIYGKEVCGHIEYTTNLIDALNTMLNEDDYDIEVMQSTCLKDKNGMEIFEGDILVNQYGNVGYVAYLQQEAGFVVVLKKSDYRLGHRNTGESYDVATAHEVIGNIYENPELLEEQR
ncbi:hypothetical protein HQ690_12145 [Enterococcus faecium]|nr:hypothetical protein [Enterococcus faecium]NTL82650.1 hypothetical protein [Enterococcus faecium]